MRLFVALTLPEKTARSLHDALSPLRSAFPRARWVPAGQMHFTLKFLGDVAAENAAKAEEALASVRVTAFGAALGAPGFFPTEKRPRVFWVGVAAGAERIAALAGHVEDVLSAAGFARETRPFAPHVTLARPGGPGLKFDDLRLPALAFRADRFVLMESRLTPAGPVYVVRRTYLLKESE